MKGINSVITLANEIINDLNIDGHNQIADELEKYSRELLNENQRVHALKGIIDLCNVKGLCDLNMPSFNGWDWLNKVEKLEKKSGKLAKQINANK